VPPHLISALFIPCIVPRYCIWRSRFERVKAARVRCALARSGSTVRRFATWPELVLIIGTGKRIPPASPVRHLQGTSLSLQSVTLAIASDWGSLQRGVRLLFVAARSQGQTKRVRIALWQVGTHLCERFQSLGIDYVR
jgi:hypothetical protein